MTDGYLCGWRVASEFPLPELVAWSGEDRPADVTIRRGPVPPTLKDAIPAGVLAEVDPSGRILMRLEAVGGYLVEDASRVVVDPNPAAGASEVRLFLLGSVLGYLCHMRGLFPLHASAVRIGGGAVAFSGHSGAGKSTMATEFVRRGAPLVADDVCAIDAAAPGGPVVMPAFPRTKLWGDSLEAAGLSAVGLERNRLGQEKYHYRFEGAFEAAPQPLRAIFLLEKAEPGRPAGARRIEGALDVISALSEQVFRPGAAAAMGKRQALFVAQAAVAAKVPVFRLARPMDFARMDEGVAMVQEALEALP